jgi:hypothetical protein
MLVSFKRKGLDSGITRRRKTTTPKPPIKCVADLQNSRLFGKASTSVRIVEPVVVKPETLSNQAFISENSPPQSTYGSIPKIKERNQARTTVRKPSRSVIAGAFFTKIKGKPPTMRVIMKLMARGPKAESIPLNTETITDINMKSALTRRARPTLSDMTFTFISIVVSFSVQNSPK